MRYRRLGRTDIEVSVIGVGTWQLGGEWGKDFTADEVRSMLNRARDLGVNLVDTAECYGDHVSEQLVGQAIAGSREHWVVATKFGHRYLGDHARSQEWSALEVIGQLERSLRALGTDYIDVYQFHSGDDAAFDNDELWEALRDRVAAGVIRHLGVSLGSNTNMYQVQRATEVGAGVIQVVYSRLDTEAEAAVLPTCLREDLGVLAREALAGGLLTGKYPPGSRFSEPSDTRSRRPEAEVERRLVAAQAIKDAEVPEGVPMAAWAMAWCLANPAVTAVLPGCKSIAQLEANVAAADLVVVRADPSLPAG